MATTYKQLVNKVLRKLRETELGATDTLSGSDYWTLIGDFVNDAKREVEDSWNWTQLRTTITVSTTSSDNIVEVTGTNSRTKIFSVWDVTNDSQLEPISHDDFNRLTLIQTSTNNIPSWYRRRGYDSNGAVQLEVYPTPDGTYSISVYCKNPQADLSSESTELTLVGLETAIVYRAWSHAISERGEDGGATFEEVYAQYRKFVEDAIAIDNQGEEGKELDWVVV